MSAAKATTSEWRIGWRIVAACAIANGTGVSLLLYTFSLFLLPMADGLGISRGEAGQVQALIILAALGAPLIGRALDRFGFTVVFTVCTLAFAATELTLALWISGLASLALCVAILGFIGGGNAAVALSRPVNAHFRSSRGIALGIVGAGASVATILVPPWLQLVIADDGWRTGFAVLAAISGLVGLPLALFLMPRGKAQPAGDGDLALPESGARGFLRTADFWLLAGSNIFANVATSGAISQMAPMIQDEGLGAGTAALGLSCFAAGQLIGKLAGGWLLDHAEPRFVAAALTVVPGMGFVLFLTGSGATATVLAGAGLIGLLQGADVDIFAYLTARRFGLARFGTAFGTLHGLSWLGTAAGISFFGASFDATGSYDLAQTWAIGFLVLAAGLFLPLRLRGAAAEPVGG